MNFTQATVTQFKFLAPASLTVHDVQPVQKTLQAARQKLQVANSPDLLRFTAYIRLSCSALRDLNARLSTQMQSITYAQLLQLVSQQDQEWWTTCYTDDMGILRSSKTAIDEALQPLVFLHQISLLNAD